MKTEQLREYFQQHGVFEGDLFTIGGLGGGEIDGIECIDGIWYTYYSERGKKRNYVARTSEDEACEYVRLRVEKLAKRYHLWKD